MIETPTTFVVGAGASCDYGFPSGAQLKKQALRLEDTPEWSQLIRMAMQPTNSYEDLVHWLSKLDQHPLPSIDEFLLTWRDDKNPWVVNTGRIVIAALIGRAIVERREKSEDGRRQRSRPKSSKDWVFELLERMAQGVANPAEFVSKNSKIRFVTFNFDSMIEEGIQDYTRIYFNERLTPQEQETISKTFEVVHVHGRLPEPPRYNDYRLSKEWVAWLTEASKHVNIVHDQIPGEVVQRAREAISESNVVFFLGFAFGQTNLERLGIPNLVVRDSQHHYFGSAKDMAPVDVNRVKNLFGFARGSERFSVSLPMIQLGEKEWDAVECLKQLPWLL